MLITNENRKRQLNNFIDEDHGVMSDFYDIMDSDISSDRLLKKWHKIRTKATEAQENNTSQSLLSRIGPAAYAFYWNFMRRDVWRRIGTEATEEQENNTSQGSE